MQDLSDIFSSKARFRILQCLVAQSTPLPLRQIAGLTNLPVRSVELALRGLTKERLLRSQRNKRNHLFEFRHDHILSKDVQALFSALTQQNIKKRSYDLKSEARKALSFADSALKLFHKAKV